MQKYICTTHGIIGEYPWGHGDTAIDTQNEYTDTICWSESSDCIGVHFREHDIWGSGWYTVPMIQNYEAESS